MTPQTQPNPDTRLKSGLLILAAVALATIAGASLGWYVRQQGNLPADAVAGTQSMTLPERGGESVMLLAT